MEKDNLYDQENIGQRTIAVCNAIIFGNKYTKFSLDCHMDLQEIKQPKYRTLFFVLFWEIGQLSEDI